MDSLVYAERLAKSYFIVNGKILAGQLQLFKSRSKVNVLFSANVADFVPKLKIIDV